MTLKDLFDAFDEISAFGLKVNYMYKGQYLRVDYVLTLSCYQIHERKTSETNQ